MPPSSAPRLAPDGAVERLYREHGHVVLRRARALLQNEDEAREILQEVFMSLVDKPDQFAGRSAVTTWLYAITTNACLTRLRNRRNRERLDETRAPEPPPPPADGETAAMLRQLLARLPDDLARVAILHHLDGMTHQEIAELLGCSRRQVGYLLDRIADLAGGAP